MEDEKESTTAQDTTDDHRHKAFFSEQGSHVGYVVREPAAQVVVHLRIRISKERLTNRDRYTHQENSDECLDGVAPP